MYNDTISKSCRTAILEEVSGNPKEVNFLVAFLKFGTVLLAMTGLVMFLFEYFSRINNI